MLRLDALTKTYKTGDQALKAVTVDVPPGQVIALIGPSGAGKSTLIRCINRLVEPTSGSVMLEDINLTSLKPGALRRERRRMGMIFQEYALVERLTVMENVLSGRLGYVGFWRSVTRRFPQKDVDEAFRLLDRVGLLHMADKRADQLSGGQRQSVAIARAVYFKAKILIMDEPTAALGVHETKMVADLIQELKAQGLGIFLISHDTREMMELCDRVSVMKNGRVVGTERVEDVTEDDILSMIILGKNPKAAA